MPEGIDAPLASETRIIHGDARNIPLPDASVDLLITSPPYFSLRSYRDGDEHYQGQIGSEATPQEFLESLWECTREWIRLLKPTGSIWVNLGDKYAGSGGHNNSGLNTERYYVGLGIDEARNAPPSYNKNADVGGAIIRPKSLMMLPARYAIGCIDQLGLILRAEVVWSKPNGLPESVTDRVRRSHEQWFHFVKQGRYFSAVDEVREAHDTADRQGPRWSYPAGSASGSIDANGEHVKQGFAGLPLNPLGKLPGSVWTIPSEPLVIPDAVREHYNLPDHFAAFPQEWPRRIILGWSPLGICVACGEGRRPVVAKERVVDFSHVDQHRGPGAVENNAQSSDKAGPFGRWISSDASITGYACACPEPTAGTRPATVLDPFCGTGTVPLVARALGRTGIGVDLSKDYCRLAEWRVFHSGAGEKAERRTWAERQLGLL